MRASYVVDATFIGFPSPPTKKKVKVCATRPTKPVIAIYEPGVCILVASAGRPIEQVKAYED